MILIFAVAFMIVWALQDWKWAAVYNITLIVPLIALPFIDISLFLFPFSVCIAGLLLLKRTTGMMPMGDVVAIPFTIFFMYKLPLISMVIFALILASLVYACPKMNLLHHYDKKDKVYKNKTKFLPILTGAFIIALIIPPLISFLSPGLLP